LKALKFKAVKSTAGYAEAAEQLATLYESITFETIFEGMLPLFPEKPSLVLDIGAGTGRDAAALARLGHEVIAVEPTAALREHGKAIHADPKIAWIDDSLPDLAAVAALARQFDLVISIAVWMHLDQNERSIAMASLAKLLGPKGRLILSLRHGPVPDGRRMFDITAIETTALAAKHKLHLVHEAKTRDSLLRPNVTWTFLIFDC
jgi:SAM-dependent methyltransferase